MHDLGTARQAVRQAGRQAGRQLVQALYGNLEEISTGSFTGVVRVGASETEGKKENRKVEWSGCVER